MQLLFHCLLQAQLHATLNITRSLQNLARNRNYNTCSPNEFCEACFTHVLSISPNLPETEYIVLNYITLPVLQVWRLNNSGLVQKLNQSNNEETMKDLQNWALLGNQLVTHYDDVIMGAMASKITSLTIVYSTVYSGADQSKHQSFASLAFVWGIHRRPVISPHKWPVTRKMFPFDDVIMRRFPPQKASTMECLSMSLPSSWIGPW